MRILVTGADGFVGRHLCRHLSRHKDEVLALTGVLHASASDLHADWHQAVDLTQSTAVMQAVAEARPEAVIHLAGFSSVGKSYQDPSQTYAVNTLGTVNLLAALQTHAPSARVIAVSSGEVYGAVRAGELANESHATAPINPYSGSKLAAEIACQQACHAGLSLMIARPFNHLGRGQSGHFVVPALATQLVASVGKPGRAVIHVGDLSPVRDFSHVDDVVEAYRLLLERGESGQIYNIASGVGRSIAELLDELLRLANVDAQIELDRARLRPNEIPYLVGDPGKLRALGWQPTRSASDALAEVLAEARETAAKV
ncbi:MAG TPA: GDP-mannose 4,6-dehydratase [Polyangiaceae bacterium]